MTSKPAAPAGFATSVDGSPRSLDTIPPDRDFCLVTWCSFVNVGLRRSQTLNLQPPNDRTAGGTNSRKEND